MHGYSVPTSRRRTALQMAAADVLSRLARHVGADGLRVEPDDALFGQWHDPEAFQRQIGEVFGRAASDVILQGPLDARVLFVRTPQRQWWAGALNGHELIQHPWPSALSRSVDFDAPASAISRVDLGPDALHRLRQPVVHLVCLCHPQNFPLPRFALGISDLARAVRRTYHGRVRLFDMQLGLDIAQVADRICDDPPQILGISATFGQHDLLEELLDRLRGKLPESTVVIAGGSLPVLNRQALIRQWPELLVAVGPGEGTMSDLLAWWHHDAPKRAIRALMYGTSDGVATGPRLTHSEQEDFLPELDLLEPILARRGVMQLEASRGCTHACSFCPRSHKGLWTSGDVSSWHAILDEIGASYDRHPSVARKLFLVDEEFVGGDRSGHEMTRASHVARELATRRFRWETSARVDQLAHPDRDDEWHAQRVEFWRGLRQDGLDRCLFGVESGVDTILARFNKRTTSTQNVAAIRTLTLCDVPIRCTYIAFDPLMSLEELIESYRFQGRRDILLRPAPALDTRAVVATARDDAAAAAHSSGRPFFTAISYMLVSMECLIGSPYLLAVQRAGLARDHVPSMGKIRADYRLPAIGIVSRWAQRWIDRHFSLDYLLKSLEKITADEERTAVRALRGELKLASYRWLGSALVALTGDEALLADEPDAAAHARTLYDGAAREGRTLCDADLELIAARRLAQLRDTACDAMPRMMWRLAADRRALLEAQWRQWNDREHWELIND